MGNIQQHILEWYSQHKRDLPWRHTEDPYYIVVSEMMLQQTQVPRVIMKYNEFIERFPTIYALARATPADVIDAWAGLGYNRRALYLHHFAKDVVEKHSGKIPSDREVLMTLSGIGPYTSRAIQCFGFGKDVPVVDVNIKRIYSRLFCAGEGTEHELNAIADKLVPVGWGVAWNNALMDFGSMVCMDKPRCPICPLKRRCTAFRAGVPEKYVKPKPQSRFKGSDRFYRSLIIKELRGRNGFEAAIAELRKMMPAGKSELWFGRIILGLKRDNLIIQDGNRILLPQ